MSTKVGSRFAKLQAKKLKEAEQQGGVDYSSNYLKIVSSNDPKKPNKYRVRLIWDDEISETPFTEIFQHKFYNPATKHTEKVICPTSFDKRAFDKCPCCIEGGKLYKKYKANGNKGSAKDTELYKRVKRTMRGFAIVKIISDPVESENNGSYKIWSYGSNAQDFFASDIFSEDEDVVGVVGELAFELEGGHDVVISAHQASSNQPPSYAYSFALKASDVELEDDYLDKLKALEFDTVAKKSTTEELETYFRVTVLGEDPTEDSIDDADVDIPDDEDEDEEEVPEVVVVKKTTKKVKKAAAPVADVDDLLGDLDTDVDVDDLINGLD